LLPRNAREKEEIDSMFKSPSFKNKCDFQENLFGEEEKNRFTYKDWKNIDIFMTAFKIKKPGVQSGETLLLNEQQSQAMAIKSEVNQLYKDILQELNIDRIWLKNDKELSLNVITAISDMLTKFLYVSYKDFKVLQCMEILDKEYGLSENEFSQIFPLRETTSIYLFSSKGKYLL
jgi:hypothetical protein